MMMCLFWNKCPHVRNAIAVPNNSRWAMLGLTPGWIMNPAGHCLETQCPCQYTPSPKWAAPEASVWIPGLDGSWTWMASTGAGQLKMLSTSWCLEPPLRWMWCHTLFCESEVHTMYTAVWWKGSLQWLLYKRNWGGLQVIDIQSRTETWFWLHIQSSGVLCRFYWLESWFCHVRHQAKAQGIWEVELAPQSFLVSMASWGTHTNLQMSPFETMFDHCHGQWTGSHPSNCPVPSLSGSHG